MPDITATTAAGGKHSGELSIAERAHEQLVTTITDLPHEVAYFDICDLYPHMPTDRVQLLVADVVADYASARGWYTLPGKEARDNAEAALAHADEAVATFLTDAMNAEADAVTPSDPFAVEEWNERR